MIKIGKKTKLGEELKVGDIVTAVGCLSCIVVYDEDKDDFKFCQTSVEEKINIFGKQSRVSIDKTTRYTLDEVIDLHSDLKVIYNVMTVTESDFRDFNSISESKIEDINKFKKIIG